MKYLFENNILKIYLEGKIDAANAVEVQKKIHIIRSKNPSGNMVLDLEKLSSLSKEGLKVLMALPKQEQNLSMINASPKIYELLDRIGLTFLINVKKALPQLSLEQCEIIGQTAKGTLYRFDEETIVKRYINGISAETLEQERKHAQIALSYGVPTITSYEIVQCDHGYATLYKLRNAVTLSSAINSNPDKRDAYTNMYAALLKRLHSTETKPGALPDAKEIYQGKINTMAKYLIEEEFTKLQAFINAVPDRNTIIHGDFHPGNVMLQDNKLFLIGMDDLSIGHPIFDFLSMYLTHVTLTTWPEQLKQTLSLSVDQISKLWDATLKNYFQTSATSYLNSLTRQMELYAGVKTTWCSAVNSTYAQENIEESLTKMRQHILPAIPSITGKLPF